METQTHLDCTLPKEELEIPKQENNLVRLNNVNRFQTTYAFGKKIQFDLHKQREEEKYQELQSQKRRKSILEAHIQSQQREKENYEKLKQKQELQKQKIREREIYSKKI